jgi:hypothetical protein
MAYLARKFEEAAETGGCDQPSACCGCTTATFAAGLAMLAAALIDWEETSTANPAR